jgi:hypothetical protein
MSTSQPLSAAVREALVKKQELARPKDKKIKGRSKQSRGVPMITGTPVRKASGRGG